MYGAIILIHDVVRVNEFSYSFCMNICRKVDYAFH